MRNKRVAFFQLVSLLLRWWFADQFSGSFVWNLSGTLFLIPKWGSFFPALKVRPLLRIRHGLIHIVLQSGSLETTNKRFNRKDEAGNKKKPSVKPANWHSVSLTWIPGVQIRPFLIFAF